MQWIYLSPHLDDAALSCGGLIWQQTQAGRPVHIWTICAGDPPANPLSAFAQELHTRWQTGPEAVSARRREDLASAAVLGADACHFGVPDCIYRRGGPADEPLYASEAALTGPLHPADADWIEAVAAEICCNLPSDSSPVQIVCPLGLGGHVDHRLTRRAAEKLDLPLLYYADYPYVARGAQLATALAGRAHHEQVFALSEPALLAWEESIAAHASQISTFWPDDAAMRAALRTYAAQNGGVRLWSLA